MTRLSLLPFALLAALWPSSGASGQEAAPVEPLGVSITVATLRLGDLQTQPILAQRIGDAGALTESSVLSRTITASSGLQATASIVIPVGSVWRARLGVGVGRARLDAGLAGPEDWVDEATDIPVTGDRDVRLVSGEVALRFVIPSRRSLSPYLEVGAIAERWGSDPPPGGAFPGAEQLSAGVSRVGAHAALGGRYPLTDRLRARLQVSMRAVRTPIGPVQAGSEIGRTDGMVLTHLAPETGPFADRSVSLLHTVRLEAGLSYVFGAVEPAPPDQSERDASPSAPGR